MNICMLHGYLLTGTGSNIFVGNLVRSLCQLGHDVFLFCQEKNPENLDYVNSYAVFTAGNEEYQIVFEKDTPYRGKCHLFNPDIKGLLPVYVYDRYKGFDVKTFTEMESAEVDEHIQLNTRAVEMIHNERSFDVIQTNHIIISPSIAREIWKKHKVPYCMTLHGSALNFTVKKDSRYLPYATEALLDARNIFAVSNHNRLEAITFFKDIANKIEDKFEIIPAGVDTGLFNILETSKRDSIEELKAALANQVKEHPNGKTTRQKQEFLSDIDQTTSVEEVDSLVTAYNSKYEHSHPDEDVVQMLDSIDWEKDRILLFVGKYLWTKGIQMAISALPFILRFVPNLQLLLVGFGSYREELEALVHSLDSGRRELFRYLIEKGINQMGPGENPSTAKPFKFIEELAKRKKVKDYFDDALNRPFSKHVHFLGSLAHKELSRLLPCADGLVAASIFPEAFGMVSIEAMACGVMPVVSNQTGFKEIVDLISDTLEESRGMPRINMNEEMVFDIATNIIQNIVAIDLKGPKLKEQLRKLTLDNFSWDSIAWRYVEYYPEGRER